MEAPKERVHGQLTQAGGDVYFFGGVSHPENVGFDDFWRMRFGNLGLLRERSLEL